VKISTRESLIYDSDTAKISKGIGNAADGGGGRCKIVKGGQNLGGRRGEITIRVSLGFTHSREEEREPVWAGGSERKR